MYKNILVAVDGSDTSNLALREAIKLAKEQQARLRLIHVIDESPAYMAIDDTSLLTPDLVATMQKALRADGEKILLACSELVREAGVEFDTTMKIIEGVGPRIQDAVEEEATGWAGGPHCHRYTWTARFSPTSAW